jgi:aryl-alcohol dehydrogenase-like predicted oxidoreductase
MQRRRLGRLGHESSVLIYGGAALAEVSQDVAEASIAEALDAGINHIDVAASYGEAELRLGPMMSDIRGRIFLATKTGDRTADEAWRSINLSLERLQTDRVDLLQLHAVGTVDELDDCTRTDGALEAAVRAQEQGLVGAVGITGHGDSAAATHAEALRRYPFATVLTPLNAKLWASDDFRNDYAALVDVVQQQDAGLMTIKTVARRNWPGLEPGQEVGDQAYTTWYEPLDDPEKIRAAVSWVLAHEEITGLATVGDVRLLKHLVAAERDRMSVADAEAVLATIEDYSSPFAAMPW